jgi:hypothetical protein
MTYGKPDNDVDIQKELNSLRLQLKQDNWVKIELVKALNRDLAEVLKFKLISEINSKKIKLIVEELRILHRDFEYDPLVRKHLAHALKRCSDINASLEVRKEVADELELLHQNYGNEISVRKYLAKALFNLASSDEKKLQEMALEKLKTLLKCFKNEKELSPFNLILRFLSNHASANQTTVSTASAQLSNNLMI